MKKPLQIGEAAIRQEIRGLQMLASKLDKTFLSAVQQLDVTGMVLCTGVGKSGHVARKLAATMTSLGTRATFIHPTEAAHGDIGLMQPQDCVLALSRSGNAEELIPLFRAAEDMRCARVLMTENPDGALGLRASSVLRLPKVAEAWGHAPTTSTIMQMALGDALAVTLAESRGFTVTDFQRSHPGGALGGLKHGNNANS